MLLRLGASNFLSIASYEEISLMASTLKGPEDGLLPLPGSSLKVLPSAVIYGANASGKTNFIKAFEFLKSAILESHRLGRPEGGVPRVAFKLDPEKAIAPTSVDADFVVEGVRFQYGFECDDERFLSEWLYSFPEGKRRKLFERSGDTVEFGSFFKGQKKILVDLMRKNSLFISTATQNDHEELSRIVSFFRNAQYSQNVVVGKSLLKDVFEKKSIDSRSINFLTALGTGVTGYRQVDVEVPETFQILKKEMLTVLRKHISESGFEVADASETENNVVIELAHQGVSGDVCYFGFERESSGTRRLILLMSQVFKALDQGSLIIIDELDASLHTQAAEQILSLFSNPEINEKGAQLIATTHDTNLLNCSHLRRDQIWFSEKDTVGASHLYPLSDIHTRKGDDFERGYLEGRYGAIPYSGNLTALFRG